MVDEAKTIAGNVHSTSRKLTKKLKQRTSKIRRRQGKIANGITIKVGGGIMTINREETVVRS